MVHAARHAEWPCHYITFLSPSLSALEVTKSPMVCHCTMHHLRPHRGGKAAWNLLFASSHGNLYTSILFCCKTKQSSLRSESPQCGVMLSIRHVQAVEVRTTITLMVQFCSSSFEVIGGLQERRSYHSCDSAVLQQRHA